MTKLTMFILRHPKIAVAIAALAGLIIEALTGVTVEVTAPVT